jgi:hypothetical protein
MQIVRRKHNKYYKIESLMRTNFVILTLRNAFSQKEL